MLDGYRIHGGHRLWHAPEDVERTYVPDDDPLTVTETDHGVTLEQPTEAETGIQKTMSLALDPEDAVVEVTHELTNDGLWPIELAPWAITVMRTGGTAVVPLTRGDPAAKLPDRSLALWPYTSLADDRLDVGDEVVTVDQDSAVEGRLKIGATAADEWAAYVTDGIGFVKEFAYDDGATYPDRPRPMRSPPLSNSNAVRHRRYRIASTCDTDGALSHRHRISSITALCAVMTM